METNLRTANTAMATTALVLGIVAIINAIFALVPFAVFWGALAVIFAWLSRTEKFFSGHAKIGFILGIISLIVSFVVTVAIVMIIIFSPAFRENVTRSIDGTLKALNGKNSGSYYDDYNEYNEYYEYYNDYYNDDDFYDNFYDYDEEKIEGYPKFLPFDDGNYPPMRHNHSKT